MPSSTEHELALMRVAVAALGERVSPPWWRTEFLTSAGMASMAMLFPHTGISSAVRAASEAARELHDTRVAKHGRFHLFRLPIVQERAVTALVASPEIADDIRAVVDGDDRALLKALNDLAKATPGPKGTGGPVWVGHVHRALSSDQVATLAAHYSLAFAEATTVFPYLDAEAAAEA